MASGEDVAAAFDLELEAQRAMREKLFGADPDILHASVCCFGSPRDAALWLTAPEMLLGGERPIEISGTREGRQRVLGLLGRLERGMYSR